MKPGFQMSHVFKCYKGQKNVQKHNTPIICYRTLENEKCRSYAQKKLFADIPQSYKKINLVQNCYTQNGPYSKAKRHVVSKIFKNLTSIYSLQYKLELKRNTKIIR